MFRSKTPVLDWLVAATVASLTGWQATAQASVVTLLTNDGGEETSFNAAGHWSNSAAPSAGNVYVVSNNYILRTPAAYASYTFAGDSLTLSNGGQMRYKSGPAQTLTIGSFILDNGMVMDGTDSGVWELAGNITLNAGGGYFQPTSDGGTPNRVINVSAAISGTGLLTVNGAYSSGSYLSTHLHNYTNV